MGDRQNSEGIAKRLVHDVPKLEHLLRMRKKQDAPGEHRLFAGEQDHFLQQEVSREKQPEHRSEYRA